MRKIFISILFLFLLINACKKKDIISPVCQITKEMYSSADSFLFSYDSRARVISYTESAGTTSITYSGQNVSVDFANSFGTHHAEDWVLNSKGNIISMHEVIGTDFIDLTFNYNDEDNIILATEIYTGSGNTSYTKDSLIYSNGNLVRHYTFSRIPSQPWGPAIYTRELTYSSQLNKAGYAVFQFPGDNITSATFNQYAWPLLGNTSRNLPLHMNEYSNGTLSANVDFQFALNNEGYPDQEIITSSAPNNITKTINFSYSCK
jgi:hypothetical protein